MLEFCRAFGGKDSFALPFACAVEAVHSYSLVHDDLPCMDNDMFRRGKPSCHAKFGEAAALLCGDALLTAAFEIASSASELSTEARLEWIRILAECAGAAGMVGGQQLDLIGEKEKLGYERLVKMNMLKTGALIRASCLLGCVAAGADEKQRAASELFAERLGLAFQLTDDLLDMGTEDGKTTYLSYLSPDEARSLAKRLRTSRGGRVRLRQRRYSARLLRVYIQKREIIFLISGIRQMDIVKNTPLICAGLAWVSAQLIKFIIVNIRERRLNLLVLIQSGGMPSSHSATVCALATAIGFQIGFGSPEFAIAAILAFIVMYDAAGVRRAAGEQAKRINMLTQDYLDDFEEDMQAQLKELLGHTPPEVFGGAVLGILIPAIIYNY